MYTLPALDHDDALAILAAAQAHALAQQWPVSIAVCDAGGHLLAFVRLKGANLASSKIAPAKAHTAVMMKRDTKLVEDMVNGGRVAFLSAPGIDGQLEGGRWAVHRCGGRQRRQGAGRRPGGGGGHRGLAAGLSGPSQKGFSVTLVRFAGTLRPLGGRAGIGVGVSRG